MNPKENPAGKGGDNQKSSLAATQEECPSVPEVANQKRPRAGTQLETVLRILEAAQGAWVGVDEFMRQARCAATHSAIARLRTHYGFDIANRQERSKAGVVWSFYRLEAENGAS